MLSVPYSQSIWKAKSSFCQFRKSVQLPFWAKDYFPKTVRTTVLQDVESSYAPTSTEHTVVLVVCRSFPSWNVHVTVRVTLWDCHLSRHVMTSLTSLNYQLASIEDNVEIDVKMNLFSTQTVSYEPVTEHKLVCDIWSFAIATDSFFFFPPIQLCVYNSGAELSVRNFYCNLGIALVVNCYVNVNPGVFERAFFAWKILISNNRRY